MLAARKTRKDADASRARDNVYWIIYANVRNKHPEYSSAQCHAVASSLRASPAGGSAAQAGRG